MNELFTGDNLEILKTFDDDSIDPIYIDPPFYTQRDFGMFDDRWENMADCLNWMEPRLKEMHRILKPTGSMYLHCDDNAVHYLKILMDQIFGMNRFVNQIQWKRTSSKNNYTY